MNTALRYMKYKLITAALKDPTFPNPILKINSTHNNYSWGCITFSQYIPSSTHLGIPSAVEA